MIESKDSSSQEESGKAIDHAKEEVVIAGKSSQILLEDSEPSIISDIHNNDTKILSLLNEAGSNYSFKGIMRKLDMHQQSLARALHRLEEMGLVRKSEGGYSLSPGGEPVAAITSKVQEKVRREYFQLLQTYIPVSSIRSQEVAQSLVGRWFKNLRWLGMVAGHTGYTLQWLSEEGTYQVNLRIVSDYVVIETNAISEKDKVGAMAGSYAIFEQIARLMQSRVGAYSISASPDGGFSFGRNN